MHALTRIQKVQQIVLKTDYTIEWDIKEILSWIVHFQFLSSLSLSLFLSLSLSLSLSLLAWR